MCGRFTLATPTAKVAKLFDDFDFDQSTLVFESSYNIAPTQNVWAAVARQGEATLSVAGESFHWGLVPSWAKDKASAARMINARGESVASKPSFRSAFRRRRCLIPADGFYEWKKIGTAKQPYYIQVDGGAPYCMAGLWESWTPPGSDGTANAAPYNSCTVITTTANSVMSTYHDRMPAILEKDAFAAWLDPEFADHEQLNDLLRPVSDDRITSYPVSQLVNKPANNSEECIRPIELAAAPPRKDSPQQGMLF